MSNVLPDPGFEEVPSLWTLGTVCSIGTAVVVTYEQHSGARSLEIASNKIGVSARCGYAERSAPTVPGRRYRVSVWMRSTSLAGRVTFVRVDGTIRIIPIPTNTLWKQYVSPWFVVAGSSALVRVEMPSGIAPVVTRYFDDLVLEPEELLDSADPSSLAGRGTVTDPESRIAVVDSPEAIRAAAESLGVVGSPASLAARAGVAKWKP